MLPIRLETHRYTSGFSPMAGQEAGLAANPKEREPLVIEALDLESPLFLRFINCESDADFQKFVDRFSDHPAWAWSDLRYEAKRLLFAAQTSISKVLGPSGAPQTKRVNSLLATTRLKTAIRSIDGASRLVLIATSTADFMALEIAEAFEAGAKMLSCPHCKKRFLFGPFTGRRSHGRYCSDRCRVAAMRARNSSRGDDA
jgi:hypothetical protein